MNKTSYYFLFLLMIFMLSCSSTDNGAYDRLSLARKALSENNFDMAKQHLDSLQTLYPRAFDERKAGLALLDTVRRFENDHNIKLCDSLILYYQPKVDSMKLAFTYVIDKKYQEAGVFVPKEGWNAGNLSSTTMRSGVKEDGSLYLESIFLGSNQMHNQIKVSTKGIDPVESLPVTDDGLNFRFTSQGKQYEVIRFSGASENGVSDFVLNNKDKAITVALEGNHRYSYPLSGSVKKTISQSVNLSKVMLLIDSLKTDKDKSAFKNHELNKKKSNKLIDENNG